MQEIIQFPSCSAKQNSNESSFISCSSSRQQLSKIQSSNCVCINNFSDSVLDYLITVLAHTDGLQDVNILVIYLTCVYDGVIRCNVRLLSTAINILIY